MICVPDVIWSKSIRCPNGLSRNACQIVVPQVHGRHQLTRTAAGSGPLELEPLTPAAEVRERGRRLCIHIPVDQCDERFHHIEDDPAAARRSEDGFHLAAAIEHDGRCHGTARPLATLDPVRDRTALRVRRAEREIGELVVEQESRRPDPRSECGFDRRRHRQRVAVSINDRYVARSRRFDGAVVAGKGCALAVRVTGLHARRRR